MAGPPKVGDRPSSKRRRLRRAAVIALNLAIATPAVAGDETAWLPPGSSTGAPRLAPAEFIRAETPQDDAWLYGRLLFRSPALLGERAVRIGLSCNGCHTNGHVNSGFFIEGLSDRPGRIDVTHRFWKAGSDDACNNPRDIPSLRGVRDHAPYGETLRIPDLGDFTRHVIVAEFAGPAPDDAELGALLAYMNSLAASDAKITPPRDNISYLPLFAAPIAAEDFPALDHLYDLILSDYGRRVRAGEIDASDIRQDLDKLVALHEKAAAGDFAAASLIRQSLGGDQ